MSRKGALGVTWQVLHLCNSRHLKIFGNNVFCVHVSDHEKKLCSFRTRVHLPDAFVSLFYQKLSFSSMTCKTEQFVNLTRYHRSEVLQIHLETSALKLKRSFQAGVLLFVETLACSTFTSCQLFLKRKLLSTFVCNSNRYKELLDFHDTSLRVEHVYDTKDPISHDRQERSLGAIVTHRQSYLLGGDPCTDEGHGSQLCIVGSLRPVHNILTSTPWPRLVVQLVPSDNRQRRNGGGGSRRTTRSSDPATDSETFVKTRIIQTRF